MKLLTLALLLTLPNGNPNPSEALAPASLSERARGGRCCYAASGHAVYYVMTVALAHGELPRVAPSAGMAALSCRSEINLLPLGSLSSQGSCVLVLVTRRARIWDPVLVRHLRSDEAEGVGVHERGRHALGFNRRHMARYAPAPGASCRVMGMLFERGRVGAIRSRGSVAIQANLIRWLSQLRVVGRAVHVVAAGAGDPCRSITLWAKSFPCMRFLCAVQSGK